MSIAAALASLDRGDRITALDELLAEWRLRRAPAIADAIDAVSADVERSVPPWPWDSATLSARHDRWLDVCASQQAVEVPRLLARMADHRDNANTIQVRLERLERCHDDPRVARALVQLVGRGAKPSHPMWTIALRMLGALRDVRDAEILLAHGRAAALRSPTSAKFGARVAKVAAALAAFVPPPVSADDAAALARIVEHARAYAAGERAPLVAAVPAPAPAAPSDRDEAALLAQIYAAIDDPAPRQVYGDWCVEQPSIAHAARGELIGLQYKANPTKQDATRVRALIKQHASEWIAGIDRVIDPRSLVFEGGFLSACATQFKNKQQRQLYANDPRWQTLRTVDTDEPKVVRAATSLRELRCNQRLIKDLAPGDRFPTIERLVLYGYGWAASEAGKPTALGLLGARDAFPALRELVAKSPWSAVTPDQFPTTGVFAHLATLRVEQAREAYVPIADWMRRAKASLARVEIATDEYTIAIVAEDELELDLDGFSRSDAIFAQLARSFAGIIAARIAVKNLAPEANDQIASLLAGIEDVDLAPIN